jgi:hypothetical protein
MEATCPSETPVDLQQTTLHYILKGRTLHNHRCENLKFYIRDVLRLWAEETGSRYKE